MDHLVLLIQTVKNASTVNYLTLSMEKGNGFFTSELAPPHCSSTLKVNVEHYLNIFK